MSYLVEQMRLPLDMTPDEAAAIAFGLPAVELQVLWEAISVNLQIPGVGKIPGFEVELDTKASYTDQQLKDLVYRIAHIEQSELEKHQASCRQAITYRDRMLNRLILKKDPQPPANTLRQERRETSWYVEFFKDEGLPEFAARLSQIGEPKYEPNIEKYSKLLRQLLGIIDPSLLEKGAGAIKTELEKRLPNRDEKLAIDHKTLKRYLDM